MRPATSDSPIRRALPRRRLAVGVAAAGALAVNTACYSYFPPPGGVIPAGSDAMIELTTEGSTTMQPVIGPRIHRIEGRVESTQTDGTTILNVETLTSRDGVSIPYAGRDAIRVPRDAVIRLDVRELDRKKSWIAGGIIGGVFAIVVVTALEKARSRASGSPGKIGASPPDLRAP